MPLLSDDAVRLLERAPEAWTDLRAALDVPAWDGALRELEREGLVETRIWPPPSPGRRSMSRLGRALDVSRSTEVRRTLRGTVRLGRILGRQPRPAPPDDGAC